MPLKKTLVLLQIDLGCQEDATKIMYYSFCNTENNIPFLR